MKLDATLMIALYGALIGSSSAAWSIIQIAQSRRRILIEAGITLDLSNIPYKMMFVQVTNLGRRPIRVFSLRFYRSKKDRKKGSLGLCRVHNPSSWRTTIQEGESVLAQIKDYKGLCSGEYDYIAVVDSVGRYWPLSKKLKRALVEGAAGSDKLPMPKITEITESTGGKPPVKGT